MHEPFWVLALGSAACDVCVSCFCMCVLISFCDVQARHFIGRTTRLLLPLGCFYLPWQTIGMATSSKWQEHYASWEWQESQEDLLGNKSRWRPQRTQLGFSQRYFMRIPLYGYTKRIYYLNMEGDHLLPVYHQALSKNILHIYYVNAWHVGPLVVPHVITSCVFCKVQCSFARL